MAEHMDVAPSAEPSVLEHFPMRAETGEIRREFVDEIAHRIETSDADFLREAQVAAELRGQVDRVATLHLAQQRFEVAGRQAMLDQLSDSEADALSHGAGSAVVVAEYRALADDRAGMLRWLAVAEAQHDHNLPDVRGYPEFAAYRDDPGFEEIVARLP